MFEVHTDFTATVEKVHAFGLEDLAQPENLAIRCNLFANPTALRPAAQDRRRIGHGGGYPRGVP